MQKQILKNLYVASDFTRKMRPAPKFIPNFIWQIYLKIKRAIPDLKIYLVGILPLEVEWEDGKKEKIKLLSPAKIEYSPYLNHIFSKAKRLVELYKDHPTLNEDESFGELITKMLARFERQILKINQDKMLRGKKVKEVKIYESNSSPDQQAEAKPVQPEKVGTEGNK